MSSPDESEIVWLTDLQAKILYAEAVDLFGGSHGIRDESLLQSALARPQNVHTYQESATLSDLSAAYGFGLARNQAFVDGNKRVALLAVRAFLFRNGFRFDSDEIETVTIMEGVASGKVSEQILSDWIEKNSASRADAV